VPKKFELINYYLITDTYKHIAIAYIANECVFISYAYKSNKIKIGVNDMTVSDSKMCVR